MTPLIWRYQEFLCCPISVTSWLVACWCQCHKIWRSYNNKLWHLSNAKYEKTTLWSKSLAVVLNDYTIANNNAMIPQQSFHSRFPQLATDNVLQKPNPTSSKCWGQWYPKDGPRWWVAFNDSRCWFGYCCHPSSVTWLVITIWKDIVIQVNAHAQQFSKMKK